MRLPVIACVVAVGAAACRTPSADTVEATGTIEVTEVGVSATIAARVQRVLVDEGAIVRPGDTLAVLTQPTLESEAAQRSARARAAAAALDELERGARAEELRRAEAEFAAAEADAARAGRDADRLRRLADEQVISAQQYDAARTLAASSAARRDALAAALALLREGARAERVRAARAEADAAGAAQAAVVATRRDLVLLAPAAGTVSSRNFEPGEVAGAGMPVVTVAESGRQYVRVFVSQAALSRIQPGQAVHAVLDAYPDRDFPGRVASIATRAEFTPRVALTERERADLLFAVKVEFADTTGMLKAGLPVTVHIEAPTPTSRAP